MNKYIDISKLLGDKHKRTSIKNGEHELVIKYSQSTKFFNDIVYTNLFEGLWKYFNLFTNAEISNVLNGKVSFFDYEINIIDKLSDRLNYENYLKWLDDLISNEIEFINNRKQYYQNLYGKRIEDLGIDIGEFKKIFSLFFEASNVFDKFLILNEVYYTNLNDIITFLQKKQLLQLLKNSEPDFRSLKIEANEFVRKITKSINNNSSTQYCNNKLKDVFFLIALSKHCNDKLTLLNLKKDKVNFYRSIKRKFIKPNILKALNRDDNISIIKNKEIDFEKYRTREIKNEFNKLVKVRAPLRNYWDSKDE